VRRATDPWLARSPAHPEGRLRLFCFPYAGGSASAYARWGDELPAEVDVCPIQLPGRDNRLAEPPFTRLVPLAAALADALEPHLEGAFAFFGHSMGALASYELTCELLRRGRVVPLHLFVSACRAPHLPDPDPPVHALPEPELIEELRRLDGTSEQVLENAELRLLVLPTLRADFAACETYVHARAEPLSIPITAFGGLSDAKVSREQLAAWREHTRDVFSLRMFPGNHFFFADRARAAVIAALAQDLSDLLDDSLVART
jgi:surfactin synthase thioesterase subunit